jgi:hypothetical protein
MSGDKTQPPAMIAKQDTSDTGFMNLLNQFLAQFRKAATNYNLKKLYKAAMPTHDILIKISAPDRVSAVEFSQILCTALEEDLLATTYPYTDGREVEVECSISGPEKECFAAVKQMSEAISEAFKDATSKIGGITIETKPIMNKKSSYQPISPRSADTNHRNFLLKFI